MYAIFSQVGNNTELRGKLSIMCWSSENKKWERVCQSAALASNIKLVPVVTFRRWKHANWEISDNYPYKNIGKWQLFEILPVRIKSIQNFNKKVRKGRI